MSVKTIASSIGPSVLPDIGTFSYNGVTFSSLYRSTVNGTIVQDEAKRTTKLVEYTFDMEGRVTLPDGATTTDDSFENLRLQLSEHAGILTYSGKGFGDLVVNQPGSLMQDVAWGPVPKVVYFEPLGGSRAANLRWQATVRIPEVVFRPKETGGLGPVLQYNYDATITYDDEGYSGISLRGTLEIPLTRSVVDSRKVNATVDEYRRRWLDLSIDLLNFRVTRRSFNYSRDRRTCDFEFAAEELPPMGLPPGATSARGTMSVRPVKMGSAGKVPMPLVTMIWAVSLRATYTIRKDADQRWALDAFYSLLWFRMHASKRGIIPGLNSPQNNPQQPDPIRAGILGAIETVASSFLGIGFLFGALFNSAREEAGTDHAIMLTDFSFDEGLYLDSKTITFQASWWLTTTFSRIIQATGVWRWQPGSVGDATSNVWAISMEKVMGWRSWLINPLDKNADVIVDMGGPLQPPSRKTTRPQIVS
jgi:hypothetical protein